MANLEMSVNTTCMSLDYRRELDHLEETHTDSWDHLNAAQKDVSGQAHISPKTFLLWGDSANSLVKTWAVTYKAMASKQVQKQPPLKKAFKKTGVILFDNWNCFFGGGGGWVLANRKKLMLANQWRSFSRAFLLKQIQL